MRKTLSVAALVALLAAAAPVLADPPALIGAELDVPGNPQVNLTVPAAAIDHSPAIVPLGTAVDPATGKVVEGIAFIHYKTTPSRANAKSPKAGGTNCYSYLANGAKWKIVEPWVMNGSNAEGLDPNTLFGLQSSALDKWEDAADGVVGNSAGDEIFGAGTATTSALSADTAAPDRQNEVSFGDVSATGAIAVTIVWGIFSGPPQGRELVEWDQTYDQVDFNWSAGSSGVAGKMDFDNIATHEDGHSAGMGHPDNSCADETMYRFSTNAETKKRDLNAGDIAGVNNLYP